MRERTSYIPRFERSQRSELTTGKEKSPTRREAAFSEHDDHSNRIKELLRADLTLLEEQNAILKAKCKKVNQLEDKVEVLLKQNSQLLQQNERLSKGLHQKKAQCETMKDKFQSQQSQKSSYFQQFEYQKRKLVKQIQHLQGELSEMQRVKNGQLQQLKSQFSLQLQGAKRQSQSTQQVYEQQLRKLRDLVQKKQYELNEFSTRMKRMSSQSQYQILRLKQEKEKFRQQLIYVQQDSKKEVDTMRLKLEQNYVDEIETIKKSQSIAIQNVEGENAKLKELLNQRSIQAEQINAKVLKQKTHYEESINLLRKENDAIRGKLIQCERLCETQKETLKLRLGEIHDSQIQDIKISHQKYIDCLQSQITKSQKALQQKNIQIQQLIKQKATIRQMFDSQANRYKEQIQTLQQRLKQNQINFNERYTKLEQKIGEKDQHIDYLDRLIKDETANFESERNSLKELIQQKKKELDSERLTWRESQQGYKETLSEYKNQNEELKQEALRQKHSSTRQIDDITSDYELQISTLQSKTDNLASRNSVLEKENKSMRDTVLIKDKQINNLNERFRATQNRQKKLQKENDQLRTKLIKKDQKMNQMLIDQKKRLEESFAFTLDNLKTDHEGAMKMEAARYGDMKEKLRRKEIETDDLMKTYKKMRDQMQGLTQQEANRKDMTLKYPGATSDLIATKNLFDIYLKTKVLKVCGDAKDEHKENIYGKK